MAVLYHVTESRFTPNFYPEVARAWRLTIYPWTVMEDLLGSLREAATPRSANLCAFCANGKGSRPCRNRLRMPAP
jgi:hypothetical protein